MIEEEAVGSTELLLACPQAAIALLTEDPPGVRGTTSSVSFRRGRWVVLTEMGRTREMAGVGVGVEGPENDIGRVLAFPWGVDVEALDGKGTEFE